MFSVLTEHLKAEDGSAHIVIVGPTTWTRVLSQRIGHINGFWTLEKRAEQERTICNENTQAEKVNIGEEGP